MSKEDKSVLQGILDMDVSKFLGPNADYYTRFDIRPKNRSGSPRSVCSPNAELREAQRRILDRIISFSPPHRSATAYYAGRSVLSNASPHHKCDFLLKTDIVEFFPSITTDQVRRTLSDRLRHLNDQCIEELCSITTLDGSLPQGAPTSPHLSNLVMFRFDERIDRICEKFGARYTRYADDISVSFSSQDDLEVIGVVIKATLLDMGFRQNDKKTRFLDKRDRKIVTGLDVSAEFIRPPRRFRKKTGALVRLCVKYPKEMEKSLPRVLGYLAHWRSIAPDDMELESLLGCLGVKKGTSSQRAIG